MEWSLVREYSTMTGYACAQAQDFTSGWEWDQIITLL